MKQLRVLVQTLGVFAVLWLIVTFALRHPQTNMLWAVYQSALDAQLEAQLTGNIDDLFDVYTEEQATRLASFIQENSISPKDNIYTEFKVVNVKVVEFSPTIAVAEFRTSPRSFYYDQASGEKEYIHPFLNFFTMGLDKFLGRRTTIRLIYNEDEWKVQQIVDTEIR